MKVVLFCHSLVSDWNHGNAHFLRGIVAELQARGHAVDVYEPSDGWSRTQLLREHGIAPLLEFRRAFPQLHSTLYDPAALDLERWLERALDGADVVIVHEWNPPALVARIGRLAPRGCRLLFHDTHHRSRTAPEEMARYDLSAYDGVLAFGETVRQTYLEHGWCERAWTWHEAADQRVFFPRPAREPEGDLVWIGNWGDEERTHELDTFLLQPVRELALTARIYGVRYPAPALEALRRAGLAYCGWLPNHRVSETFARFRATVHVPRGPYVEALPGVPTIRVFEALACGIPLVCAPWRDEEGLFSPGSDYLLARDGTQMRQHLRALLAHPEYAAELAGHGLRTIRARHTCTHRVDELLAILATLAPVPQERSVTESVKRSLSHA
ncbi:CgeB family protein [Luteimonas suaedae]|uniref:CgeB family protein n=1 Tax=Luteimonas suaedae TaxID=2605430 RepID=UPI0011EBCF96|nr:glycosyltransferase [Luteimonas suaedae]